MAKRIFTTTGWNDTGEAEDLGVIDGVQTYRYLTIDKALNESVDGDFVTEDVSSAAFVDAAGYPLQTITIPLGSNITISAAITLFGTRSRLRLDGTASGTRVYFHKANATFVARDVDFVSGASGSFLDKGNLECERCAVVNYYNSPTSILGYNTTDNRAFYDCAFINCTSVNAEGYLAQYTVIMKRCTLYACSQISKSVRKLDNVVAAPINGTYTPLAVPSVDFVSPPPDDPADVTDWSAWTSWDFRLKTSSTYATGATSVTSGETVYDLAGNKRGVGGALGAYERLSGVTHIPVAQEPGWRYATTRDDETAPTLTACCVLANGYHMYWSAAAATWQIFRNDEWTTRPIGSSYRAYFGLTPPLVRATSDASPSESSSFMYVQEYAPGGSSPSGSVPCGLAWNDGRCFTDGDGAAITSRAQCPTPSSVCYIDNNADFASTQSTVGKVYVAGWTHVDLGDLTATVVIGKGATARSSGKLTIENETTTSAEMLSRLIPRAPAEITFKECVISD